jgi:MFS family permease
MTTESEQKSETEPSVEAKETPPAVARFQSERTRHFLWNMVFLRVYIGFWGIANGFVGVATILPVFMARVGLSKILIGILPAVWNVGGLITQPISAYFSAGLARKKGHLLLAHIPCLAMAFLLGAGSFFVGGGKEVYSAVLVLGTSAIFAMGSGLTSPPWFDLVAKAVPLGKRGTFFGLNWALISGMSVLGAFLARFVLDRWAFPVNFGISFLVGAALYFVGVLGLFPVREPSSPEVVQQRPRFREFIMGLFREVHLGVNYRNFLVARTLIGVAYMPIGFLSVYAIRKFALPSSAAAYYTMAMTTSVMVMGMFLGRLGEKMGYRSLTQLGPILGAGALVWALLAPSANWFALVFFLVGMAQMADFVGIVNIMLESCPRLEKAGFLAASNILVTPGFAIGPVLGGVIAQRFTYEVMFVGAICVYSLCWIILTFFCTDPRRLTTARSSLG